MSKIYMSNILVVGCGLSGVVIAERIANIFNKKVTILEKRDHIGGNCYDYIESESGILMNKYGAHLFHTNNERVWNYINQFDTWIRWEHKVVSYVDNKFVPIPVNITTVNELCGEHLENETESKAWHLKHQVKYDTITNSEELAKSTIGDVLYDKLIKNYTFKQWNKYPHELNKSVLGRIPIRYNFDTRYFSDKYQALPHKGYTHFFEKILDNKNIEVKLNTDYFEHMKLGIKYDLIIFTGPIDSYFSGLPKLEYRSINFKVEVKKDIPYFQPNSVVNYPGNDVPFTRIVEYKHFLNQQSKHTVIVSETTNDSGEPYYPVPNKRNEILYEEYKRLAINEETKNVFFVGRLANYKYFNMDQAILNSLEFFDSVIRTKLQKQVQFVVARFNEDISWLNAIKNHLIVYSKGIRNNNEILLPNVGRESHTYLYHIIQNYECISDITVFTQGSILDHGFNLNSLVSFVNQVKQYEYSLNFITCRKGYADWTEPDFNIRIRQLLYYKYKVPIESIDKIVFCDWFKKYIDFDYPEPLKIYVGGIFAVSRERIISRPKSFYEGLLAQLQTENNPIEGHFMERSWYYIFNCHKLVKISDLNLNV